MGFMQIPNSPDGETLRESINIYQTMALSKGYDFKVTTGLEHFVIHETHDRYSGGVRLQIRFKVNFYLFIKFFEFNISFSIFK